jgi:proteasome lid subunit RPN8/RPN11
VIILSGAHLASIERATEAAYPAEACGLIVGLQDATGHWHVAEVIESANILANERADRFEVDPQVRIDTERRLRGSDHSLIGHYHSHPDHPAEPSATDREMAYEPNLIWLITSVAEGKAGDTRAFMVNPDRTDFEAIGLHFEG